MKAATRGRRPRARSDLHGRIHRGSFKARFFDALREQRAAKLTAVSMDMGKAYPKVTAQRAPQAVICWDSFHVIA